MERIQRKQMKREKRKKTAAVHIPRDILLEIFEKLDTKSLLRLKCVSKSWCNMIEDPEFVLRFQVLSNSRGTKLLIQKGYTSEGKAQKRKKSKKRKREYFNDFLLLESEAQRVSVKVPSFLRKEILFSGEGQLQHVEGLLHYKNLVWNPTTREVFHLPPRNPSWDLSKVIENIGNFEGRDSWRFESKYFFGFDVSTKKHKVLCICRMILNMNTRKKRFIMKKPQVSVEVLTLGTNRWTKTSTDLPRELLISDDFATKKYYNIKGKIYIICKLLCAKGKKTSILIFDTSDEKFQLLPLDPLAICGNIFLLEFPELGIDITIEAGELMGRFAVMDKDHKKIWILEEDLEGGIMWNAVDLFLPENWYTNLIYLKAIAFNPIGEIFFQVREYFDTGFLKRSSGQSTVYIYNMERKDVREVPNLTGFDGCTSNIFPNFVETIQRLSR